MKTLLEGGHCSLLFYSECGREVTTIQNSWRIFREQSAANSSLEGVLSQQKHEKHVILKQKCFRQRDSIAEPSTWKTSFAFTCDIIKTQISLILFFK